VGFGGGLGGPNSTPRPLPLVIDPDGAKGLVGVVGGPPAGLGGRAGSDIDGNLSEDASSDKVRGVKDVKIPKISKIRKRGEAKHVIPQAGFFCFFYLIICILYYGTNIPACNSSVMAYKKTQPLYLRQKHSKDPGGRQ